MSSLRNAIHRREHRERAQPQSREKWGLLEKHKDYSLRAQDYNAKKTKLKRLQEKAAARNPDEFAFGMMSERSRRQGRHGTRDSAAARALSHDAIKLLKTQDAGYLRTVGERVRRELEKVEQEVRLQKGMRESLLLSPERSDEEDAGEEQFGFDSQGDGTKGKRLLFADGREEQRKLGKQVARTDADTANDAMDGLKEDDSIQHQSPRVSQKQLLAQRQALLEERRIRKMRKRTAQAKLNKVTALRKQYSNITAAERELSWQRARMDSSVGGTNKNGIKWKIRERKR